MLYLLLLSGAFAYVRKIGKLCYIIVMMETEKRFHNLCVMHIFLLYSVTSYRHIKTVSINKNSFFYARLFIMFFFLLLLLTFLGGGEGVYYVNT